MLLNNNAGVICNAMWYDHSLGYNYTRTESLLLVTALLKHPPQTMASLQAQVRQELQLWYGNTSQDWLCIWEYHIPYVGFDQQAGFSQHLAPWCSPLPQVYYASEANSYGGLGGAIESGEKIAALLLHDVHSLSRPRGA